jgi:hypothetical protein
MSEQAQAKAASAEPNPALGRLALETFRRDLPRLMKERPGQWVAYHGDRLIGFAKTPTGLYQDFDRRGVPGQEYHVGCIEPEPPLEFECRCSFDDLDLP